MDNVKAIVKLLRSGGPSKRNGPAASQDFDEGITYNPIFPADSRYGASRPENQRLRVRIGDPAIQDYVHHDIDTERARRQLKRGTGPARRY